MAPYRREKGKGSRKFFNQYRLEGQPEKSDVSFSVNSILKTSMAVQPCESDGRNRASSNIFRLTIEYTWS